MQSTTGDLRERQRMWVYRRDKSPCRRCGTPIRGRHGRARRAASARRTGARAASPSGRRVPEPDRLRRRRRRRRPVRDAGTVIGVGASRRSSSGDRVGDLAQHVGERQVEGGAERGEQLRGGLLLAALDLGDVAQAHPGLGGDLAQGHATLHPLRRGARRRAAVGTAPCASPSLVPGRHPVAGSSWAATLPERCFFPAEDRGEQPPRRARTGPVLDRLPVAHELQRHGAGRRPARPARRTPCPAGAPPAGPGPATPVVATPYVAPVSVRTPRAIARAQSAETTPCSSTSRAARRAGTPSARSRRSRRPRRTSPTRPGTTVSRAASRPPGQRLGGGDAAGAAGAQAARCTASAARRAMRRRIAPGAPVGGVTLRRHGTAHRGLRADRRPAHRGPGRTRRLDRLAVPAALRLPRLLRRDCSAPTTTVTGSWSRTATYESTRRYVGASAVLETTFTTADRRGDARST